MLGFVLRDNSYNNMKRNETDQNGEAGDVEGLWSTCRGPGSCQKPCNPPPETPALHSTLSSPPPHHDKPDLHSITEPQAASLLLPSLLFLSQRSSSHLSFTPPLSQLASRGPAAPARHGHGAQRLGKE